MHLFLLPTSGTKLPRIKLDTFTPSGTEVLDLNDHPSLKGVDSFSFFGALSSIPCGRN